MIRFLLVAWSCLLVSVSALATGANVRADGTTVIYNGVTVLRLRAPLGAVGAASRAEKAVSRIREGAGGVLRIRSVGKMRVISMDGLPVVTVTPLDARIARTSVASLTMTWYRGLQGASNLPPLKLSDNFVRLPVGGSQTVRVIGTHSELARAVGEFAKIATVTKVPEGFVVKGLAPGKATVSIECGVGMENIELEVRPYAANFPQSLDAEVSGAPASVDTIRGAIQTAVRTQFSAESGGKWSLRTPQVDAPINTGDSKVYPVRVWAAAPNCFPSSGIVYATVRNIPLPVVQDADLWYSNNPETVRQTGCLFAASLRRGNSTRFLYHHVNEMSQDIFLRIQAINETDRPAKVVIIPGDSKPDRNPVRAGLTAANQYLPNWLVGSGEVVTIPAGATLPISLRRLPKGVTASGLCSIRLIEGPSEILVRADAFPPFPIDQKWSDALISSTPWRVVGTHPINDFDRAPMQTSLHIYPNPYKTEEIDYQVGGRYGFIRIGQKPIARLDSDGNLDGNFGVAYNFKTKLTNPLKQAADVEIVFEASAGYSGGAFFVNGRYIKTPLLQPKEELRLALVHLAPGMTNSLVITTMPLSGSSYPATITIRPISK